MSRSVFSLLFFVFFVFFVGLSPQIATAQPPSAFEVRHRHGGGPPFDRFLERHAERLKLDDATRERIRAIGTDAMKEVQPLRQKLQDSREEMRKLLVQDTPDETAVMQQAERIGSLETELQKHRLRTMLRIRALLTPEQRQELVKIHQERGGRQRRHAPDEPTDSPALETPLPTPATN
jgi:Spy/CpxP family protein refolding chaperone